MLRSDRLQILFSGIYTHVHISPYEQEGSLQATQQCVFLAFSFSLSFQLSGRDMPNAGFFSFSLDFLLILATDLSNASLLKLSDGGRCHFFPVWGAVLCSLGLVRAVYDIMPEERFHLIFMGLILFGLPGVNDDLFTNVWWMLMRGMLTRAWCAPILKPRAFI